MVPSWDSSWLNTCSMRAGFLEEIQHFLPRMKKPVLKAGGIVVRHEDGQPRVLVVTTKKEKRWILPKGKIARGEKPSTAALRESREEGCVTGRLAGHAGSVTYTSDGRRTRVEYYLIRYTRDCSKGGEDRDRRWCTVRAAIRLLSHANTRRVVRESRERIVAVAKPTGNTSARKR